MTVVTPARVDALANVPTPSGVMRPLRLIAATAYNFAAAGNTSVAIPATVIAGDLLIMFKSVRQGRETQANEEATGWTFLDTVSTGTASGNEAVEGWVYQRVITAADITAGTITYAGDNGGLTRLKRTTMI